jgi:GT2 family glycosyltransferase
MKSDNGVRNANDIGHSGTVPVSIVVLSHNRLGELSNDLSRLLSESHHPDEFQIIVVDNNSTDGSREFLTELRKMHPEVVLVLNDKNLGVGGGRNSGFAVARREYVVALDDDATIATEDLRRIPDLFDKYLDAGLLAFCVVHPVTGALQNPHGNLPCEVANHHGAGFAFRRPLYVLIGGIDEECDFGAEELDFAIRARAQGWSVLFIPELTVYHNSVRRNRDLDQFRRIRRAYNNVRVYYKYFPRWMAFRNSRRYVVLYIWSWLSEHGFDGIEKMIGAAFRGRRAGITNHQPVPADTVVFYDNPALQPEFGNVSITDKLIKRFTKM